MLDTWKQEISLWAPDMVFYLYRGSPAYRKELRDGVMKDCKLNIMITQYEFCGVSFFLFLTVF